MGRSGDGKRNILLGMASTFFLDSGRTKNFNKKAYYKFVLKVPSICSNLIPPGYELRKH